MPPTNLRKIWAEGGGKGKRRLPLGAIMAVVLVGSSLKLLAEEMDRIEVRPAPIRRRGCTPANKPNSILIKAHRQKLLAAIAANPGATRSQLRREFAASSVRYLARHDLDWLVRVLPAPKKYDWPEKDRRLAEAVPAAARELLMGPAPPRRVTATRIAQKISTDD